MCIPASLSTSLFSINYRPFLPHFNTDVSVFNSSQSPFRSCRLRPTVLFATSIKEGIIDFSWFDREIIAGGDYGGWEIPGIESSTTQKREELHTILSIGISFAVLFAFIAHFAVKNKGFKFDLSTVSSSAVGMIIGIREKANRSKTVDAVGLHEESGPSEIITESNFFDLSNSETPVVVGKQEPLIIPVAVDSTQLEALVVLKKLKIIDDDVNGDELCTKREYTRNPMYRIVIPSMFPSESIIAAFDDVRTHDTDFWSIQALAEAGIISSKLSINFNHDLNSSRGEAGVCFSPESFITRQDMISWRIKLDSESVVSDKKNKIANTNVGFMDMKEFNFDASPELFRDIHAGENGIHRKVFGIKLFSRQCKRFQPNKPCTKAQAAVAISSGKQRAAAIQAELSLQEAENSSRQALIEEIKTEILGRGDIQRFWDAKMEESRIHGLEAHQRYAAAIHDLEVEKIVQENNVSDYLKEKTAIDYLRKELVGVKKEIIERFEVLGSARAQYVAEKLGLESSMNDLVSMIEGMLDAKSVLEAEKEALRLIRSWVEAEARRSLARAMILEEAGQRWKWEARA